MVDRPGARDRKSIFVTGGASGIGRATCRLFAERGWFVGAYDVDEAGLASLEQELGSENCLTRRLDVSDKAEFDRAMEEFSGATGGRLDLLFNNAGIGAGGSTVPLRRLGGRDSERWPATSWLKSVASKPRLSRKERSSCVSEASGSMPFKLRPPGGMSHLPIDGLRARWRESTRRTRPRRCCNGSGTQVRP